MRVGVLRVEEEEVRVKEEEEGVEEEEVRVEEEEVRVEEEALGVEEDELARVEDLAFPAKEFFFADDALRGIGMGTETFDATLELERV